MGKSRKAKRRKAKAPQAAVAEPRRRDMIKLLCNGALGSVVLAGGGYAALGSFRAHAAEHDLTRLGQGKAAVVQVHDPQCPTCTALQTQTRKALKGFGECDLVYLIADINTPEGQAFAVRYGVGNVTLLLFDGAGGLQQTLQGMQSHEQLVPIFNAHHATHGLMGA